MTDERQTSSTTFIVVVLAIVVLVGLVAVCACGGIGIWFLRALPQPQAVPGQPMPQQIPPVLVPREVPPTPKGAELERGDGESKQDQVEPKAEREENGP